MRAASSLFICLLIAGAGTAPAQTASGAAADALCAQESGAAARVCTEYCQTLACRRAADADAAAESQIASPECQQARARFESLTGRDLPCEEMAACPCADPRNWADPIAGLTWGSFAGGYFNRDSTICKSDPVQVELEQTLADVHPQRAGVDVTAPECRVFDGNAPVPVQVLRISARQADVCRRVLRRAGGSLCR